VAPASHLIPDCSDVTIGEIPPGVPAACRCARQARRRAPRGSAPAARPRGRGSPPPPCRPLPPAPAACAALALNTTTLRRSRGAPRAGHPAHPAAQLRARLPRRIGLALGRALVPLRHRRALPLRRLEELRIRHEPAALGRLLATRRRRGNSHSCRRCRRFGRHRRSGGRRVVQPDLEGCVANRQQIPRAQRARWAPCLARREPRAVDKCPVVAPIVAHLPVLALSTPGGPRLRLPPLQLRTQSAPSGRPCASGTAPGGCVWTPRVACAPDTFASRRTYQGRVTNQKERHVGAYLKDPQIPSAPCAGPVRARRSWTGPR
jgi:hypothetical protein